MLKEGVLKQVCLSGCVDYLAVEPVRLSFGRHGYSAERARLNGFAHHLLASV